MGACSLTQRQQSSSTRSSSTRIPVCPLCLLDLVWATHKGISDPAVVRRTASWMWPDIRGAVHAVVLRARMREIPHAEEALRDVTERGDRGVVARRIVTVLARRLADDYDRRQSAWNSLE
ncbi:MAG: hypothetical protein M3322_10325 [Actinomycetota bacterium]|nr:hypothetical protein [Actinomycetota bacterium]